MAPTGQSQVPPAGVKRAPVMIIAVLQEKTTACACPYIPLRVCLRLVLRARPSPRVAIGRCGGPTAVSQRAVPV